MEEIPDPRAPYNQKHKILDIIVIAVTAILCGMDTWNEIEDWAKSKREWLGSFLELPGGFPVNGDNALYFPGNGSRPPEKGIMELFRIYHLKYPVYCIMGGYPGDPEGDSGKNHR